MQHYLVIMATIVPSMLGLSNQGTGFTSGALKPNIVYSRFGWFI